MIELIKRAFWHKKEGRRVEKVWIIYKQHIGPNFDYYSLEKYLLTILIISLIIFLIFFFFKNVINDILFFKLGFFYKYPLYFYDPLNIIYLCFCYFFSLFNYLKLNIFFHSLRKSYLFKKYEYMWEVTYNIFKNRNKK